MAHGSAEPDRRASGRQGALRGGGGPVRGRGPRHLLGGPGLRPDRHHRHPGHRGRHEDAVHRHRGLPADVPGRLRLPGVQPGRPGLRHLVHVDHQGVRPLRGVARRVGGDRGHRHRAVQPRRGGGAVLLPAARVRPVLRRASGDLWENSFVNVATCLVFLAVATFVAYRGITTTERIQVVLVLFQLVVLVVFAVAAFARAGASPTGLAFDLEWFSPVGLTLSAFIAGLSGSIFAFWGWDTSLTVNEETSDSDSTPGAGGAAVHRVDPADLPPGDRGGADVRRRGHRGHGPGQRGHRRQRLRGAGRAGARAAVGPRAVPVRAGLQRGEPDHHVPAHLAHDARDGCLPGAAPALHPGAPDLQNPLVRHPDRRDRRRGVLHRAHVRQRAGPDRHDLLAWAS